LFYTDFIFVCLFYLYPPVTRKTVALYFGRILTCLGVSDFQVFRLFFRLITI